MAAPAEVERSAGRSWLPWRKRERPKRKLTFTREGRIAVILAIAVGIAAMNTGNNLLFLLLGWVLSFIIASGVLSEMTMRGLVVTRNVPPVVVAGEPFLLEVIVDNQKAGRASYSIEVEDLVAGTPVDKRCYFLKIPAGKQQRASYRHTIAQRGLHRIEGARLATKFPFALFRKTRDIAAITEVLVFPPRVPVRRPMPNAAVRGDIHSSSLGRSGEFFGLREHRLGDDRRAVHWRSSARSGRLLVREFEDETARRIVLVLDNGLPEEVRLAAADHTLTPAEQAMWFALERAVATVHSLAAAYIESNWSVELIARGCHVPAGQGRAHAGKLARALALLPAVALDAPFAIAVQPRSESVMVVPMGVANLNRPMVGTVLEA
ncbi:MAG TPA: DUF58 domain-containing protein [Kofleriaceae bacterium]|nr:DUF58 domain-containing protein [Kofleriaceae bacterium]